MDLDGEKERDLTQSYDENPSYTNRKFNKQLTTQKCHQNFDYTTIADRFRTVSLSNNGHPTGIGDKQDLWLSHFSLIQCIFFYKQESDSKTKL